MNLVALLGTILLFTFNLSKAASDFGGWIPLTFSGPGTFASETIAYNASLGQLLQITDTLLVGDRYSIYNDTTLLGITSIPNPQALHSTTLDPDVAMSSQFGWSNAFIMLPYGNYIIKVKVEAVGYVDAGAWIRVDNNYAV